MRIFRKKDGEIVQIIDKEKMNEWPIELPLLFVEYIRTNKLESYGAIQKEVSAYLDEIMRDVAIPRLIKVLESDKQEEIVLALTRIEELTKKNIELARPIKPYLDNLLKNKAKEVVTIAQNIIKNFEKADRKKEMVKKKKIMQDKEKQFLEGKISGEDYAKARKDYLVLKEE